VDGSSDCRALLRYERRSAVAPNTVNSTQAGGVVTATGLRIEQLKVTPALVERAEREMLNARGLSAPNHQLRQQEASNGAFSGMGKWQPAKGLQRIARYTNSCCEWLGSGLP
jgi:hypothetical protein